MNQTASTEVLDPEVVSEASQRVEAVLHGSGVGGGQMANGAAPTQAAPTQAAPAPRPAAKKRNGHRGRTATSMQPTAATANDSQRTLTITLPKEVAEWYEQQAAAAPFEPSVQRYISWELRELAKQRKAEAEADRAMIEEANGQQ